MKHRLNFSAKAACLVRFVLMLSMLQGPLLCIGACQSPRMSADAANDIPSTSQTTPMKCDPREDFGKPAYTELHYHANHTPAFVKARNLAAALKAMPDFQRARQQGDHAEMTYLFLRHYRKWFLLSDPRRELRIEHIRRDALDSVHVTLQQVVGDVPVWGKRIKIHFDQQQQIYLFQGDYSPGLLEMNTTPGITTSDAVNFALTKVPGTSQTDWMVADCELLVFVGPSQNASLVYGVTLQRGIAQRRLFFMDAFDGHLVHQLQMRHH